jgi:hypothetical protein
MEQPSNTSDVMLIDVVATALKITPKQITLAWSDVARFRFHAFRS